MSTEDHKKIDHSTWYQTVLNDYLLWDLIFQPFPEDFALIKIKIIREILLMFVVFSCYAI